MTNAPEQSWLDAFDAAANDLPGEWLTETRRDAINVFREKGLPHRRLEDWKYTDLRRVLSTDLPLAEKAKGAGVEPLAEVKAARIRFVNGFFAGAEALPQGVEVINLAQALLNQTPWVREHLGTAPRPEGHPMLALNTALMRDGVAIRVTGQLETPLMIIHEGEAGRQLIRNLIVVEEGAKATLIEAHVGGDAQQQVHQTSDILVGANARLHHLRLQDAGTATVHMATDLIGIARDGFYDGFVVTTGADLSRQESFIEYKGENAEGRISGTYLLSGKQHADVTTRINHAVPHCVTREAFKGVITDEARGVFQGKILVAKDAQKTDGHMLNKTLLLSPKAEIDTKPELEIYADDVKCSHGATTGQIDEDQLFYLRARGIDEPTARGLLIHSFITEVLSEVSNASVREALEVHVAAWLAEHAGIKEIAA